MMDSRQESAETRNLLRQARRGDQAAFEQLFAQHRPELKRMVELRIDRKLRARFDPSDVVQEAHLRAVQRLDDFLSRKPMPLRSWLWKTTYECLLNMQRDHRAARRNVEKELPLPQHSSLMLARQLVSAAPTPSQQASRREFDRGVCDAVAQLPDTDREILLMRTVDGLSHTEIGDILEIEHATARKRYGRALLQLRQLLIQRGLTETSS